MPHDPLRDLLMPPAQALGMQQRQNAANTLRSGPSFSATSQRAVEGLQGQRDPGARRLLEELFGAQEALGQDPLSQARERAMIGQDPAVREALEAEQAFEIEKESAGARAQGEAAIRAAQVAGQSDIEALEALRGAELQPGESLSISGIGSRRAPAARQPARAPVSVTNRLLKAQQGVRPTGIRGLLGMGAPAAATSELQNVIQEVASAEGIHPGLIQQALQAAESNPTAGIEELMGAIEGDDLEDFERDQFLSIFSRIR
jgi:hypothetical protein